MRTSSASLSDSKRFPSRSRTAGECESNDAKLQSDRKEERNNDKKKSTTKGREKKRGERRLQFPTVELADPLEFELDVFEDLGRRSPSLHHRPLRQYFLVAEQGKERKGKKAETHLISLLQRNQLIPKQLPHLRVLDDPSQSPRREVRISTVSRVEGDVERRRGSQCVEVGWGFGEGGDFEVVADGESV
jgi:hypothetical protein